MGVMDLEIIRAWLRERFGDDPEAFITEVVFTVMARDYRLHFNSPLPLSIPPESDFSIIYRLVSECGPEEVERLWFAYCASGRIVSVAGFPEYILSRNNILMFRRG